MQANDKVNVIVNADGESVAGVIEHVHEGGHLFDVRLDSDSSFHGAGMLVTVPASTLTPAEPAEG